MPHPPYVVLEKPVGQTPLEAIAQWKNDHPQFAPLPATYAGRLDPMARGKLLVLLGSECKKRAQYLGMDKEYEVEVILGVSTDTGDMLGLAQNIVPQPYTSKADVHHALTSVLGTHSVPYPAFSSKTVNGTPLFQYALEGTLSSIVIPEHDETIYSISLLSLRTVSPAELVTRIRTLLSKLPRSEEPSKTLGADFRQDAIRQRWAELLQTSSQPMTLLTLRVTCASGTYMRTLAQRIGVLLETQGTALSIHRTKIGRYKKLGPFGIWIKKY